MKKNLRVKYNVSQFFGNKYGLKRVESRLKMLQNFLESLGLVEVVLKRKAMPLKQRKFVFNRQPHVNNKSKESFVEKVEKVSYLVELKNLPGLSVRDCVSLEEFLTEQIYKEIFNVAGISVTGRSVLRGDFGSPNEKGTCSGIMKQDYKFVSELNKSFEDYLENLVKN